MAVVSRYSRWMKTCISSLKMFGGNKKYPEEFITNARMNCMHTPPLRAGSTMQGALVSFNEFQTIFAHPGKYGQNPMNWPRRTILLYKYSTNATTEYMDIPKNTWKRVDNEPNTHKYAEEIMIEELETIREHLKSQRDYNAGSYKGIHSVEVIGNYSPCSDSSSKICSLKNDLDEEIRTALSKKHEVKEVDKIRFQITFSNFYKHTKTYGPQHWEGLKKLLEAEIKLDILKEDNWYYFLNAAGLIHPERQGRENNDKKIFQYLEESAKLEQDKSFLEDQNLI